MSQGVRRPVAGRSRRSLALRKAQRGAAHDLAAIWSADRRRRSRDEGDGRGGAAQRCKPALPELRAAGASSLLLPKDAADERNAILEVRAGTGGEEAALFAAELFRMYQRYAELHGWRFEVLSDQRDRPRRLQGGELRRSPAAACSPG